MWQEELLPAALVYGAAEGAPFLGGAFGGEDAYLNDCLQFPGGGNPALGAEAVPEPPVRQLDFRGAAFSAAR